MFKSKKRQNEELFTPLLQETQSSEIKNHKFQNNLEEIDMEQMDGGLEVDLGDDQPTTTNSTTSKKLAVLIDKRNKIRNKRKQNKILEFDFEDVAKEPEDCKYYIISIIMPLLVFIFLLVVLFAFIISPIIQGMNAKNNNRNGNNGTSHLEEHGDNHHHHGDDMQSVDHHDDMQSADHPSSIQTDKTPHDNPMSHDDSDLSSSVKKDGDKPNAHHSHDKKD